MTEENKSSSTHESSPYYVALRKALETRGGALDQLCPSEDSVARRVLHDYGAIFVANNSVLPPAVCVFSSEKQVAEFQKAAGRAKVKIGDDAIELQPAAMSALLKARAVARAEGRDITPRDGTEAARRNFGDTVRLWNTRFLPALDHWTSLGRLTSPQADRLRVLPASKQVAEVLELERDGIFFSKDRSKSVLYSIAAPGTSQHIAMLAFDANEFLNQRVREILAAHGWFQTVLSDLPHFTFLGLNEDELPGRGLKKVKVDGQVFWIPNIG